MPIVSSLRTLLVGAIVLAVAPTISRGSEPSRTDPTPTYSGQVAAIMRVKCENCHRPGQIGPFALQTYKEAAAWSKDIKTYVTSRQMPPWKPVAGYGEFRDEARNNLSDAERETIVHWVDAGAPQGDPKQTPPPSPSPGEWKLGTPDMIFQADRDFVLSGEGEDIYRNFALHPNFTEDRYLRAVEVNPGAKGVVHHIKLFRDDRHTAMKYDGKEPDGQPGYTGGVGVDRTVMLGGWAPGNDPIELPDGLALKIPAGADLVLEMHYHNNGKPARDRTRIGLYFAKKPIEKLVYTPFAINPMFLIPPGDSHYEAKAPMMVGHDSHLFAITPHMHLLGRDIKVWAHFPDGSTKPIVWIDNWDFNWQVTYVLKEPMALPAGTRIEVTAHFDNSSANPRNPFRANPRPIRWGEKTTDEMVAVFMGLTHDAEHLNIIPK